MLSIDRIIKSGRSSEQYGEGEHSFSPRGAEEHRPSPYAPGVLKSPSDETRQEVRRVLLANGNITFIANNEEIPAGGQLE